MIIQGSFPGGIPYRSVILENINSSSGSKDLILQRKSFIQKTSGGNTFRVDANRLNLNGPGFSMPAAIQKKMESVFNTDFSSVKIHSGGKQAESIGALAFTTGNDIYFAHGYYSPNSVYGQKLLGHELTHVVQQRSGRVNNPFGNGIAVVNDHGLEAEAERMGILSSNHNIFQLKINPAANRFSDGKLLTIAKSLENFLTIPIQPKLIIQPELNAEAWGIALNMADNKEKYATQNTVVVVDDGKTKKAATQRLISNHGLKGKLEEYGITEIATSSGTESKGAHAEQIAYRAGYLSEGAVVGVSKDICKDCKKLLDGCKLKDYIYYTYSDDLSAKSQSISTENVYVSIKKTSALPNN